MYQIVHGTAGILIGSQTGNPVLAFILGLISHFILDVIPHDLKEADGWRHRGNYNLRFGVEALVDLILLIILIITLWQTNKVNLNTSILAAIIGSIIPDYILGFTILTKTKNIVFKKIEYFHSIYLHKFFRMDFHLPARQAVPIQVGTFVILLGLILFL